MLCRLLDIGVAAYLGRGGDLLTGTEQSGLYNKAQVTLLNAVGVLVSTGGQGQDAVRSVYIL